METGSPEDEDNIFLRNVGIYLQVHSARNTLKTTVFWDIAPCSLVEIDRRFGGAYSLHHNGNDGGPDYGGCKHV
jgi:hypothetical protein